MYTASAKFMLRERAARRYKYVSAVILSVGQRIKIKINRQLLMFRSIKLLNKSFRVKECFGDYFRSREIIIPRHCVQHVVVV
jgi:hypothetical protein